MDLGRIYNYFMVELDDPLTHGWPLLNSPFPITIITAVYIFALYIGPRYMKNRSPYSLRSFILFYNFFQILVNVWIVKEHISAGWLTEYSLNVNCGVINNDPITPNGIKLITIGWWILTLKIIDYIETCIFVLRKKQNQVSILHVYHHVFTVFFGWFYLKYIADPVASVCFLINSFVHAIMYTYYFAAAWSTKFQQIASPIKPYLTKLQMMQFLWLLYLLMNNISDPKCKLLSQKSRFVFFLIFSSNLLLFLYLFYNFYKKTYGKICKQKSAKQEK